MANQLTSSAVFPIIFCFLLNCFCARAAVNYYGKYLGALKSYHHGLAGDVYVVDSRTLHVRNFAYDGEGPAGYFYVSNTKSPNENGIKLRDEKGTLNPLKKYRRQHITLTLPEGKTMNNIKWFYVWCDEFAVNFGDVRIPKNLDFPKPQKVGKLHGIHGVSSENIVVVDAQTLLIPSFSYDGEAPDAKFWAGSGAKPSPQGIRIPDENGKETPLRRYNRKTIVLTLPADLTIFDIGHFGVWCEAFTVDFGHVQLPKELNIPPSLKMLGVSPQKSPRSIFHQTQWEQEYGSIIQNQLPDSEHPSRKNSPLHDKNSKLNCEILYDDLAFEVRWAVAGDSIVIQLVSKLEKNEYMSFGVSGQIDKNVMIGGDVVVAWVDHETLNGYAYDYILESKSQCAGNHGSCPDVKLQENTDSVRLLNAALVNGYSIVTYQRPLRAHDSLDLPIYTNGSQAIIWAIGPLNSAQEVSYHSITSKATTLLDFGRTPQWNCPIPESDATVTAPENEESYREENIQSSSVQAVYPESNSNTKIQNQNNVDLRKSNNVKTVPTPAPASRADVWEIPPIQCYEPEDGVFYAQMGPTGGKRGYSAITGHVGWGISWYINGLLIPEINVVRGKTYTFIVEGGLDPEIAAKYHPFYITDDPVGGFLYKTPEEKLKVQIFSGVVQNKAGELVPTGIGRLCNWTPDPDQPSADEFLSFGAYQRTLSLVCDHGEPGVIQWTPDENTPDTVYYQCYSHRYLGWKINVHDTCDKEQASSEQVVKRVKIQNIDSSESDDPLQSDHSIQIATRVKPANGSQFLTLKQENSLYGTEEKSNLLLIPSHLSDNLKHDFINADNLKHDFMNVDNLEPDFINAEQEVLQDPYMPPPPYQKNFDYQSMQYSKTPTETKPSSKEPKHKITTTTPTNIYNVFQENVTQSVGYQTSVFQKPQNVKQQYHKMPYIPLSNNNSPKAPIFPLNHSKNQYPAMHIHIIKHDDSSEEAPLIENPIIMTGARPLYHSMVIRKPSQRIVMQNYQKQRPLLPPIDSQVSASIPAKSILVPPVHPLMSSGMLLSYAAPPNQVPKKLYVPNRKREDHRDNFLLPQIPVNVVPDLNTNHIPSVPQNSGFNPSSIVIESGFKPILPNAKPQQDAQDRSSSDDKDYIEEDVEDTTSSNVTNSDNNTEDYSKNPFEGKQPELFEPMFIPSPLVSELQKKKKPNDYDYPDRTKLKFQKPSQSGIYFVRHKPKLTSRPVYSDYLSNAVLPSIKEEGEIINGISVSEPPTYRSSLSPVPIFRINPQDQLFVLEDGYKLNATTDDINNTVSQVTTKNAENSSANNITTTHANNHRYPEDVKYKGRSVLLDHKTKRENVEKTPKNAFIIMVPDVKKDGSVSR